MIILINVKYVVLPLLIKKILKELVKFNILDYLHEMHEFIYFYEWVHTLTPLLFYFKYKYIIIFKYFLKIKQNFKRKI